jgi:hypothetical protein
MKRGKRSTTDGIQAATRMTDLTCDLESGSRHLGSADPPTAATGQRPSRKHFTCVGAAPYHRICARLNLHQKYPSLSEKSPLPKRTIEPSCRHHHRIRHQGAVRRNVDRQLAVPAETTISLYNHPLLYCTRITPPGKKGPTSTVFIPSSVLPSGLTPRGTTADSSAVEQIFSDPIIGIVIADRYDGDDDEDDDKAWKPGKGQMAFC